MKCLECGAENAEATRVCARCGAPAAQRPSAAAAPAAGRTEPSSRRNGLILGGLGVVLLLAVTVLVWSVTTIVTSLSTSSRSTASPPMASTGQLAIGQLQPGDCLAGPNLGLGRGRPWPDLVTAVPCVKEHRAEVFFSADLWPRSLAAYPGDKAIANQGNARCLTAFTAYDGIVAYWLSEFEIHSIAPRSASDWAAGDRLVVCVAYKPTTRYPGGAPVDYSIRGSDQ